MDLKDARAQLARINYRRAQRHLAALKLHSGKDIFYHSVQPRGGIQYILQTFSRSRGRRDMFLHQLGITPYTRKGRPHIVRYHVEESLPRALDFFFHRYITDAYDPAGALQRGQEELTRSDPEVPIYTAILTLAGNGYLPFKIVLLRGHDPAYRGGELFLLHGAWQRDISLLFGNTQQFEGDLVGIDKPPAVIREQDPVGYRLYQRLRLRALVHKLVQVESPV